MGYPLRRTGHGCSGVWQRFKIEHAGFGNDKRDRQSSGCMQYGANKKGGRYRQSRNNYCGFQPRTVSVSFSTRKFGFSVD